MLKKNKNTAKFHISDIKVITKIVPYLMQMKQRVFFAMLFLFIAKIALVGVPMTLKNIVDSLDSNNEILILPISMLAAYIVLRLISSIFNELRDAIFAKVRYKTMRIIAVEVFKHLHKLDLSFHLDRNIGAISRDIDRGVNSISTLLAIFVFNIMPSIFEILLVTSILFFNYNSTIAVVIFVTVIIYVILTISLTQWRIKYRYQMNDMQSSASNLAIDSLINYETVKYFNKEEVEIDKYNNIMQKWQNIAIKSFTAMTFLNFAQGLVITAGVGIILFLTANGVIDNSLSLGDLIMIQALLLQLFLPLGNLGIIYRQIKHNFIDISNMFFLLDKKPAIIDTDNAKNLLIIKGNVEFKNVNFCYKNKKQILKNIHFTANKGQITAIVGSSGAGKSTITKLLFRFFDIDNGEILIDKQNIKKITTNSLRKNIGVVPQDIVLLNDTIFANIAYGANKKITLKDVRAVAQDAFIDDFIMSLPDDYQTKVGERGLKLSGGEKQRISIARVLLKNPPILIFDEATSALDNNAEKKVQKALNSLSKNRTTIVIAHRLSTIIGADKILVLNNGKITEQGTHNELLNIKGLYYKMLNINEI